MLLFHLLVLLFSSVLSSFCLFLPDMQCTSTGPLWPTTDDGHLIKLCVSNRIREWKYHRHPNRLTPHTQRSIRCLSCSCRLIWKSTWVRPILLLWSTSCSFPYFILLLAALFSSLDRPSQWSSLRHFYCSLDTSPPSYFPRIWYHTIRWRCSSCDWNSWFFPLLSSLFALCLLWMSSVFFSASQTACEYDFDCMLQSVRLLLDHVFLAVWYSDHPKHINWVFPGVIWWSQESACLHVTLGGGRRIDPICIEYLVPRVLSPPSLFCLAIDTMIIWFTCVSVSCWSSFLLLNPASRHIILPNDEIPFLLFSIVSDRTTFTLSLLPPARDSLSHVFWMGSWRADWPFCLFPHLITRTIFFFSLFPSLTVMMMIFSMNPLPSGHDNRTWMIMTWSFSISSILTSDLLPTRWSSCLLLDVNIPASGQGTYHWILVPGSVRSDKCFNLQCESSIGIRGVDHTIDDHHSFAYSEWYIFGWSLFSALWKVQNRFATFNDFSLLFWMPQFSLLSPIHGDVIYCVKWILWLVAGLFSDSLTLRSLLPYSFMITQTIAAVASYFLIVADFSRSTVAASRHAKSLAAKEATAAAAAAAEVTENSLLAIAGNITSAMGTNIYESIVESATVN